MKYDLAQEKEQFTNFMMDQYNIYKEVNNIYQDYLKLPLLLTDALFTMAKHAGLYTSMRITKTALDAGQQNVAMDDDDWELVVTIHNKLVDFISDTLGPKFDPQAIDIVAEDDEDFAQKVMAIVDGTFSQALGVEEEADEDQDETSQNMQLLKHDDQK